MIYAATVKSVGVTPGSFFVIPKYTRVDGTDAPDIEALPVNGLVPTIGDTVICAEGLNDLLQSSQMIFNDNGGAFPLIIASLAQILVFSVALTQIKGLVTLGEGGSHMLLGETVQTWAQSVDAAITALYAWGATGVAPGPTGGINPFPQVPLAPVWPPLALSLKHQLD